MQKEARTIRSRVLGNGFGLNMTNDIDQDNEDWLLALSGEPRQGADSFTNSQAEAIRAALKRRAEAIEQETPEPSESGYHRLLFRLKKEGHIGPDADKKRLKIWAANDDSTLVDMATGTFDAYSLPPGMRSSMSGGHTRSDADSIGAAKVKSWFSPALGMAAVFVIGAALVFYMQVSGRGEEEPYAVRSSATTVLIVSDQSEKVVYLVDTLNPLGGQVKIIREADGSVSLVIKANDKVLERLAEDRIQPDVKAGYLTISIVSKQK